MELVGLPDESESICGNGPIVLLLWFTMEFVLANLYAGFLIQM